MTEDPRQVRTRAKLTEALVRLIERDGLSTMSVVELCNEAGVHRTTFYGHATTIEEFTVGVVTRIIDEVSTVDSDVPDPIEAYRRAAFDLFERLVQERTLVRAVLSSTWAGALRHALDERMQYRVRIALDVFATRTSTPIPEHREFVVAFISGGIVGAIVEWVLSDETDVETWATRMQGLMPPWWPVH